MSAATAPEISTTTAYQQKLKTLLGDRNPLDVLEQTPAVVARIVGESPPASLRRRPFADRWTWTPLEIVGHLCDAEWTYGYRIRTILGDDRPVIIGYNQDKLVAAQRYAERDPAELLDLFRTMRRENLRLWKQLTPAELERVGLHSERGPESLGLMLRMHAGHDLSHIEQIAKYLAAIRSAAG